MGFGGGSNSSSGSMEQAAASFLNSVSSSGGSSFGSSGTQSQGSSLGTSSGSSFVDQAQAPFLQQMYADAMKTYRGMGDVGAKAQGIVNPLMKQGQGFMANLGSLADPTQQIAEQSAGLKSGLQDLFMQGKNDLFANASGAGAFGGSRQGVAEGALGGEIAKAFTQGRGDIVANANNQAAQASQMGLAGTQGLYNLGMAPVNAAFSGLSGLSSIIGGPTVLSRQSSLSQSLQSAFGWSKQQAENFAKSMTESQSRSAGSSSSDASGFDFNFDFSK